jgi:hypothetical protein
MTAAQLAGQREKINWNSVRWGCIWTGRVEQPKGRTKIASTVTTSPTNQPRKVPFHCPIHLSFNSQQGPSPPLYSLSVLNHLHYVNNQYSQKNWSERVFLLNSPLFNDTYIWLFLLISKAFEVFCSKILHSTYTYCLWFSRPLIQFQGRRFQKNVWLLCQSLWIWQFYKNNCCSGGSKT